MPYAWLDDDFYDHPKLDRLPTGTTRLACIGLYWLAISWSNRYLTDGLIPADRVRRLGGSRLLADALVEARLWERSADDYVVHDFGDYSKLRVQVEVERQQKAEAGRKGGLSSGSARRKQTASTNEAGASRLVEPRTVPLPLPLPSSPSSFEEGSSKNGLTTIYETTEERLTRLQRTLDDPSATAAALELALFEIGRLHEA